MPFRFGRGGRKGHRGGRGGRKPIRRGIDRRFGGDRPENCICPSCGTILLHKPGSPCFQMRCPQCGTAMTRQFIKPDFINQREQTSGRVPPKIDSNLCTGCKKCMQICPVNAIEIINEKATINEFCCNGCRICVSICPKSAII